MLYSTYILHILDGLFEGVQDALHHHVHVGGLLGGLLAAHSLIAALHVSDKGSLGTSTPIVKNRSENVTM